VTALRYYIRVDVDVDIERGRGRVSKFGVVRGFDGDWCLAITHQNMTKDKSGQDGIEIKG